MTNCTRGHANSYANTDNGNDNKNNNDGNYNKAPFHSQISVNKLSTSEDSSLTGTPTLDTKTLMGSDEEIWHVYAKQIGALICENSNKPLLVGIALKKHSPQTLQQILRLLQLNRVW